MIETIKKIILVIAILGSVLSLRMPSGVVIIIVIGITVASWVALLIIQIIIMGEKNGNKKPHN